MTIEEWNALPQAIRDYVLAAEAKIEDDESSRGCGCCSDRSREPAVQDAYEKASNTINRVIREASRR